MRQLASVALLVVSLLATVFGSARAEDASPPPWMGGRVEIAEYGFAVTLPEGWVAFDPGADIDSQVRAMDSPDGGLTAAGLSCLHMNLSLLAAEGSFPLLGMDLSSSVCSLAETESCLFYPRLGEGWRLDAFAEGLYQTMVDAESMVDADPPMPVDVPTGPGLVLRATAQNAYDRDVWGPVTMYLIDVGGDILTMTCSAFQRPDDDWLSIAETVETLPLPSDQVISLLPHVIGDTPLSVESSSSLVLTEEDARRLFRRLISDLGQEFRDLQVAHARTADRSVPEQYVVEAIRVAGVPPVVVMEQLVQIMRSEMGTSVTPPLSEWPTRTYGERTVWTDDAEEADDGSTWSFMYTVRGVLFIVSGSGGMAIEDVLAELPT